MGSLGDPFEARACGLCNGLDSNRLAAGWPFVHGRGAWLGQILSCGSLNASLNACPQALAPSPACKHFKGTDAMKDLAVLAISGDVPSELQPLPVASSGDLKAKNDARSHVLDVLFSCYIHLVQQAGAMDGCA